MCWPPGGIREETDGRPGSGRAFILPLNPFHILVWRSSPSPGRGLAESAELGVQMFLPLAGYRQQIVSRQH